jgi:sulfide:quinone oxidoreductase
MPARIVVLGGGVGGTLAANLLARHLGHDAHVTVIDPTGMHVYQPGFLYAALGKANGRWLARDERTLLRKDVDLVVEAATLVEPAQGLVRLAHGGSLAWDYLVLATGARLVGETVPGLIEGAHEFYSLEGALRLREALRRFGGGRVLVGVAGIPYKCPPAPVEFTLMLDQYLRRRGLRDRSQVTLLSPLNRAFTIESASKLVQPIMERRGIGLETFFNVESVDPSAHTVSSLEGDKANYDLLVLVPPHAGQEVIAASGLGDAGGWVPTDRATLAHRDHERVFAIGDATDLPISKSGSTAHFEAQWSPATSPRWSAAPRRRSTTAAGSCASWRQATAGRPRCASTTGTHPCRRRRRATGTPPNGPSTACTGTPFPKAASPKDAAARTTLKGAWHEHPCHHDPEPEGAVVPPAGRQDRRRRQAAAAGRAGRGARHRPWLGRRLHRLDARHRQRAGQPRPRRRHLPLRHPEEGSVMTQTAETATAEPAAPARRTADRLVIFTWGGDLDKVWPTLILATTAAAMGMEVLVFFTFWGLFPLVRNDVRITGDNWMQRAMSLLHRGGTEHLKLSQMNFAGAGPAMMRKLAADHNVASPQELLELAREMGVRLVPCQMTMDLLGLSRDDMIDGLDEPAGAAAALAEAQDAITLFI